MKKIELYQLAFYLAYNIKVKDKENVILTIADLSNNQVFGFTTSNDTLNGIDKYNLTGYYRTIKEVKPILKSISDIPQSEINELFEMFGDLCRIGNQLHFNEFLIENFENLDTLPLRVCQELAKRGYDIFNLLENNLAINYYNC
ncbi:MAG: hypothetical protein ACRC0V_09225 [Fusobacteriaceae bacterium]